MISLEQAIYARLTGHAGTAALVGARVYPGTTPQNPTFPFIVFEQTTDDAPWRHLGGRTALRRATMQIDIYSLSRSATAAIARQVRFALDEAPGTITVGAGSLVIVTARLVTETDTTETDLPASAVPMFRTSAEYSFVHQIPLS